MAGETGADMRRERLESLSPTNGSMTSEYWEVGVFDMLSEEEYVWEIGRERDTERELSRSVSDPEFAGLFARRRDRYTDDTSDRADEGGRE